MRKLRNLIPLLVVLSFGIVSLSSNPVAASPETSLSVLFPNGTSLSIDEYSTTLPVNQFTVKVCVASVCDLYAYEFTLKYNPSVLTANSITIGSFLLPVYMIWKSEIDETAGTVWFAASQGIIEYPPPRHPEPYGVTGSGTLATITFTVDSLGASMLLLYNSKLCNSLENPIVSTGCDGYFTNIGPVPVAVFAFTPQIPERLETVTFNASRSYTPPGTDPIVRYRWDFGDGAHDTSMITTHYYGKAVNYNVTLTVTNDAKLSNTASASITVKPYIVNLVKEKAWPEYFSFNISKYGSSQNFYAKVQNFNNASIDVEAVFSVYFQNGVIWLHQFSTPTATLEPGEIKTLNCSVYMPPPGTYTVEAHTTYFMPQSYVLMTGHVSKTFTLTVVV